MKNIDKIAKERYLQKLAFARSAGSDFAFETKTQRKANIEECKKDFIKLFTGVQTENKISWLGQKGELKSFVDFLLSLGKIENCQSNKWTITAANCKFLNDDFNAIWISWFKNRFLPVYLNYQTCLYGVTKRNDIKGYLNAAEKLKPNEALGVAKLIMGTNGIWTIKDFCFKNDSNFKDRNTMLLLYFHQNYTFLDSHISNRLVSTTNKEIKYLGENLSLY